MASRCPTTNWWLSQAGRHEGAFAVPVTVPPWNRLVRGGIAGILGPCPRIKTRSAPQRRTSPSSRRRKRNSRSSPRRTSSLERRPPLHARPLEAKVHHTRVARLARRRPWGDPRAARIEAPGGSTGISDVGVPTPSKSSPSARARRRVSEASRLPRRAGGADRRGHGSALPSQRARVPLGVRPWKLHGRAGAARRLAGVGDRRRHRRRDAPSRRDAPAQGGLGNVLLVRGDAMELPIANDCLAVVTRDGTRGHPVRDVPDLGHGVGLRREHAAAVSFGSSSVRRPLGRCGTLPESIGQSGRAWHPARRSPGRPCAFRVDLN